jgi:ABC-type uncharacterized transport system permease subunit
MKALALQLRHPSPGLQWTATIVGPLLAFALFLLISGANPYELYGLMVNSVFGDWYGIGEVVIKSTPFILTALAASLPAKAGMINVGGEGQLAIGALVATWSAVYVLSDIPGPIGLPLMALFGALGGALWASIAGLLKVKGNMNETITTLLMNYIAFFTIGFFCQGILKDPASFNWPFSPPVAEQLRLPTFTMSSRAHMGIFIAIAVALLVWFVIYHTRLGFKIRTVGGNAEAARQAGINVKAIQLGVLIAAGAIAGLAGMIEISGIEERLRPTTGVNYGYLGFLASWMAWNHPLRLVVTAFIIGTISVAGNSMEMNSGLPASSVQILMALVLFALLIMGRRKKT